MSIGLLKFYDRDYKWSEWARASFDGNNFHLPPFQELQIGRKRQNSLFQTPFPAPKSSVKADEVRKKGPLLYQCYLETVSFLAPSLWTFPALLADNWWTPINLTWHSFFLASEVFQGPFPSGGTIICSMYYLHTWTSVYPYLGKGRRKSWQQNWPINHSSEQEGVLVPWSVAVREQDPLEVFRPALLPFFSLNTLQVGGSFTDIKLDLQYPIPYNLRKQTWANSHSNCP